MKISGSEINLCKDLEKKLNAFYKIGYANSALTLILEYLKPISDPNVVFIKETVLRTQKVLESDSPKEEDV